MEHWRFIDLRDVDPYRFQCVREATAVAVGEGSPNTLFLAQIPQTHISIGKNASMDMVRSDYCAKNNIPVTRSFSTIDTAGFIDSSIIRFIITIGSRDIEGVTRLFYEAAIGSLASLGLVVEHIPDTNNIVINGKKMSLCSIKEHGDVVVISWSVALDFNHAVAEQAIVSAKDMREWVTSIKAELGREVSVDELRQAVKQSFQKVFDMVLEDGGLTAAELKNVDALLPKYTSETWLKLGRWSPVKDYWRPNA